MVRKTSSPGIAVLCLGVSVTFYMTISIVLAQPTNQTTESKQKETFGLNISSHNFPNSAGNAVSINKNKQFSNHKTAAGNNTVPDVTNGPTVVKTSKVVSQSTTEKVITSNDTQSSGPDSQSTTVNKLDKDLTQPSGSKVASQSSPVNKFDEKMTMAHDANLTQPSGSEVASQSSPVNKFDEKMTMAHDANLTQPSGSEVASQSSPVNKFDEKMTMAHDANLTQPSGSEVASQSSPVNKFDEKMTMAHDANLTQPSGSEVASQSKPDQKMTTASVDANLTQPSGSEVASQSTPVIKPDQKMTTASVDANLTQPSGSEVASQSSPVTKPDEKMAANDDATVTQPSVLDPTTTAEVFLQSDIKIVAKPAVEDGHFIIYLIVGSILLSVVYIVYHNKNKILSLCQKDGPKRTRRPKTSEYQRLDQNLSEVITSLKKKPNFKMS